METKSPINTNTNTNLPSPQTAHSDFPMVVENHNHNPHIGTETGTENESRNGVNTSHPEINTQPPPPSYNTHADQHSSEKRTVEDNHNGGHSNETPPQFQIHPEVSMSANGNANGGGKYEGQHPAPLTSLQKESRLWKRSGKTEVSVAASAAAASGNAGGVGGAGGK
ncbi:hypothetical protein BGAL_0594g00010 [Botrytis galanthina]|uniref:Uncharacterized protein n=1 Tax=Botrytis galanthina TaxID=278940 RepID=A0A4S8QII0_9HELO|nr:hypothetical protein BGAL_0594g00010 [Botrytis galanthina]